MSVSHGQQVKKAATFVTVLASESSEALGRSSKASLVI